MFFTELPTSAVVYCRVSSEHQAEQQTIQNQVEFATNYCKLNNIELQHIYKDDGITGTLPLNERPAGKELLDDAKEGKFTLCLVFKLDRLGRATRVILNAVHELDEYGVKVKSMTEPFDTSDASGRFLLTILAGVADLERENILQRMGLGSIRAAKKGKYMGGTSPYGYTVDKDGYYALNTKPLPNGMTEVEVVRLMYDLCLQGFSCQKITERIVAMGVPTYFVSRGNKSRMGKWTSATVYRMLKSNTYKGVHYYGRNKIEREVPPIIDADTWEKAQKKLASNKSMIKGHVKRNYLLRGLIKCKHCGFAYSGSFTDKYGYYVDVGRMNYKLYNMEKPCIGKTLRQDWAEPTVWESCLDFIRNPQLLAKSSRQKDKSAKIKKEIVLIRSKLAHSNVEHQRLIDLYKAGAITLESVTSEFEKVNAEKDMLQSQIDTLEKSLKAEKEKRDVSSTVGILEQIQQRLESPTLDFETKKAVVDKMIDRIIVDSITETITIYFSFGEQVTHTIKFMRKPRYHF